MDSFTGSEETLRLCGFKETEKLFEIQMDHTEHYQK